MVDESNGTPDAAPESTASSRLGQAKAFVGDKYDAASRAAREQYNAAAGAVKEKIGEVRQKVEEVDFDTVKEQATDYVRSNPVQALAISVGIGFLIGFLVRRAIREED